MDIVCNPLSSFLSFYVTRRDPSEGRTRTGEPGDDVQKKVSALLSSSSSASPPVMKLDATDLRYVGQDAFRVLAAVSLIPSRRGGLELMIVRGAGRAREQEPRAGPAVPHCPDLRSEVRRSQQGAWRASQEEAGGQGSERKV
jgi:hypothetical protein